MVVLVAEVIEVVFGFAVERVIGVVVEVIGVVFGLVVEKVF